MEEDDKVLPTIAGEDGDDDNDDVPLGHGSDSEDEDLDDGTWDYEDK